MLSEIGGGGSRPLYNFEEYIQSEHLTSFPQVETILKESDTFQHIRQAIKDKISIDFDEARIYVDGNFEKARHVNDFVETWSFEEFKQKVTMVQTIKEELAKIKEWYSKDVPSNVPSQPNASVKGILNIEGKTIRS